MAAPVIGYRNFLRRPTAALSSETLAVGSSMGNMLNSRITSVTDLGAGPSVQFDVDFGSGVALAPDLLMLRFRGRGWMDLESVNVLTSANSDLSSPSLDETIVEQFPATWPQDMPVRPVMAALLAASTAQRYARLVFTRTAGESDLLLSWSYLGEATQLVEGLGHRAPGSGLGVEDYSTSVLSGLQSDVRTTGAKRRFVPVRVVGMPYASVLDDWYPGMMYAASGLAVAWLEDPDEADAVRVQTYCFPATAGFGEAVEIHGSDGGHWEQEMTLREVI